MTEFVQNFTTDIPDSEGRYLVGPSPKYFIYTLSDPFTQEVRYVGLSTYGMKRPLEHFTPSSLKKNIYKNNWIKSVISKGKKPTISIVGQWEVISKEDLCAAEKYWIKYFRSNGSPLTNLTDGGEGIFGHKRSEKTREKVAASLRGRKHSEERKANISAGKKGKKHSPQSRANMSAARIGNKNRLGYKESEEVKAKLSAASKGKNKSDKHKASMSAARRGKKKKPCSDEARANMSAARIGNKARLGAITSEETKEKLSIAMKAWWSKKKRGAG